MAQYPGATHTFNIYRRNQKTTVGNNIVVAPNALISSGESILIKDSNGMITNEKGALVFSGVYTGSTYLSTAAMLGDILEDQSENDINGNPVKYTIEGLKRGSLRVKFHLKRLDIGV